MTNRIFNFNAGPATLPLEVLREVQAELLDFQGTGMSILEISHRSKEFQQVLDDAKQDIRDLLHLSDDFGICFMAGGGTLQFSCVPVNFLTPGTIGAYAVTGSFADKALEEARKVGETAVVYSSREHGYNRVPLPAEIVLPERCAYLHITCWCKNSGRMDSIHLDQLGGLYDFTLFRDPGCWQVSASCIPALQLDEI